MNSVDLELEEIHKELVELRDISENEKWGMDDEFDRGYATGQESAYADCSNKIAKLLEFSAKLHSTA